MENWEDSKQIFIDKLRKANDMFDEIFEVDSGELLIQGEEREDLKNLQAANKKILKKLESREFTVAIVGLEKAGKSTLGNALINLMVLPEYTERCTYTTTEIRSGDTNIAEVYFYSVDEFNKNFHRMLNEIEYPDAVNFSAMTLDVFEKYWREVENDPAKKFMFQSHDQTTARDIKEMLSGKSKITPLLGHDIMTFDEKFFNADDKFNQFKQYVTGLAGENPDGSVIRQPYPYAVKNIIIHSTKLADMKNMVIYDVPGFDSPTELHKRQTEEMLKESDAIILVTNAGDRPNLTGTQLDMLRKGQDSDGIKLSAKAFVFGNKIDTTLDVVAAKRNFLALRNDSIQNQIAKFEHIFCGSARAYLERIGLLTGDISKKRIEEWQLPDGDGIENLRKNMQEYYDTDRFAVLQRRAESVLDKTKIVLQNLYDRYSTGELDDSYISAEILMEMQSRLDFFIEEASGITHEFKRDIVANRPFTTALQNDIENIYPLVEEYTQLIQKAENNSTIDVDGVYPTTKVDSDVRNMLESIFVENIVKSASRFTDEKQKQLRQKLVDSFLKNMGLESSTTYKAELDNSVNKLFDQMLIEGGATCNFNSLVERFVTTIIQTLITHPFAVHERYNKVIEALDELVALSVYYNMPRDAAEKKRLQMAKLIDGGTKFFARILAHEDVAVKAKTKSNVNAADNEIFLRQIFEINKDQIGVAISLLPIGEWAKLILQAGINLKYYSNSGELRNNLEYVFYQNRKWTRFSNEQKIQAIKIVIDNFITKNGFSNVNVDDGRDFPQSPTATSDSLIAQINEMQTRAKEAKQMQGKDDMIKLLDTDILLLRDITARAVINAIGLERAFNSVIIKNVDLIRRHLKAPEGNKSFQAWIRANAAKVRPLSFGQIEAERVIRESRKSIVNVVKKVLNNWN